METPSRSATSALSGTTGVFFAPSRKRFHNVHEAVVSTLFIDHTGTIKESSKEARALLEYPTDQSIQGCFFSLVHSKNQYRVMRDIADMLVYGKRSAEWFIRLRTGRQRWQWYRATAQVEFSQPEVGILIRLHEAIAQ